MLSRVLSRGGHKLARRFSQAPLAVFPFFHRALPLAAVKLAKGRVLWDILDHLVVEPAPDPSNWRFGVQLRFGRAIKPQDKQPVNPSGHGKGYS